MPENEYVVVDRVFGWQLEIGDWVLIGECPAKIVEVVDDDNWMMAFKVTDQNDDEDIFRVKTDETVEVIGWL